MPKPAATTQASFKSGPSVPDKACEPFPT